MSNYNFIIYRENKDLVIYDFSSNTTYKENIDNWNLNISSTKMEEDVNLDVINYLYNLRQKNELYIITPETLKQEETFTDGLYKFILSANNDKLSKTHFIILYDNIYRRFKELLEKYNYKFEISKVGYINWIDDSSDYFTEELRTLSGLIDQLQNYQFLRFSEQVQLEIDDIIDKAERIAEIIK